MSDSNIWLKSWLIELFLYYLLYIVYPYRYKVYRYSPIIQLWFLVWNKRSRIQVELKMNPATGESRGFAFITFSDEAPVKFVGLPEDAEMPWISGRPEGARGDGGCDLVTLVVAQVESGAFFLVAVYGWSLCHTGSLWTIPIARKLDLITWKLPGFGWFLMVFGI